MTPFLLMGAMSPVSIPATLVQQIAEALTGIALCQLVQPGCPVVFGSFLSQHRHAVRARPASARPSRRSACSARARSRATSGCRSAVRRRADRLADGRRPERLRGADDAAADVPGRHQLRHALGRLARGRAGVLLREVHRRHRAAADAAARVHAAGDRRGVARVRRPRGGRLGRALPRRRCTRSSASASASTGRCCPRPRTSTAGRATAARTRPSGRAKIWRDTLDAYEEPPIDDAVRARAAGVRRRRRTELGD